MKKAIFHPLPMILVLGLVLALGFFLVRPDQPAPPNGVVEVVDDDQEETYKDLIRVTEPKEGEMISLPLVIRGEARGNWYFEATFPVNVLDDTGKILVSTYAEAQGDWMTEEFVPFELRIDHIDWGEAEVGNIILMKANASGLPQHGDQYLRYFLFPPSENYTNVSLFWGNTQRDPDMLDCSKVFATERTIKKETAAGSQALELLLNGPTQREQSQGYFSSIPVGTSLRNAEISDGVFTAEFSPTLDENIGGSCLVTHIRSQIAETLEQFPTVEQVRILVEGKDETEVLQP